MNTSVLIRRLNIVATAATLGCALLVVHVQHRSRTLFLELEAAHARTRALELDWSQLQFEQSSLGKSERVEEIATRDLHMQTITAARTQYLAVSSKQDFQ